MSTSVHLALGVDTRISAPTLPSDRTALASRPRAPPKRQACVLRAALVDAPSALPGTSPAVPSTDPNQHSREGAYEAPLVHLQASKDDPAQPSIATILPAADPAVLADVMIIGCGPAGLALAAQLGQRGINVVLVGHDVPFVNNYGVWVDEFEELGLAQTLDSTWNDAICYFNEGKEVRVGRAYGRVCRRRLRAELLKRCADFGVKFWPGEVESIQTPPTLTSTSTELQASNEQETWSPTTLRLSGGTALQCKMATLASGAAAGRFLKYESDAPSVAAQTAYGIEAEVEGYDASYDASAMLFMDYRRHHTGLWNGSATRLRPGEHPNGGHGLWGTEREVPSFLYAMPLEDGKVFLEETCLVSKPPLPFAVLKRRLERRCEALGLKMKNVVEEEWSYIPTGGPLPIQGQSLTAFGAAANLVHPATGYSIARSLREAPAMAAALAVALREQETPSAAASFVWEALWSQEKRRQASFHIFGMELLCQLNLASTAEFFDTFFGLPRRYWQGFLASKLSSVDLLAFAMATFILAPPGIKAKLVTHLATHPAGKYMIDVYLGNSKQEKGRTVAAAQFAAGAVVAWIAAQAMFDIC